MVYNTIVMSRVCRLKVTQQVSLVDLDADPSRAPEVNHSSRCWIYYL